MTDTINTPLMNMTLPVPGVRLGPQWAVDLNVTALGVVDGHDHSPGKGPKVTPAGLDITADLDFQSNDAITLRSTRYAAQSAPLSGVADLGCFYLVDRDFYANDGVGNVIRLTNGGAIDVAGLAANIWPTTVVTTDVTILPGDSFIVLLVDTTITGLVVSLPPSTGVAAGRFYVLKDTAGTSETHAITFRPNGTDTIDGVAGDTLGRANHGTWILINDAAGHWEMIRSGTELNGASVPLAGSLTTGNVLKVSGTHSLTYGPLDLALAASTTGVLPAPQLGLATTAQSGAVQLTHDLDGTATVPIVKGVSGASGNPLTLGSLGPSNLTLGAADVRWPATASSPELGILARTTTGAPTRVRFYGQDQFAGGGAGAGGGIDYVAGLSHGASTGDTNTNGDHRFRTGGFPGNTLLHLAEVVTGRNVVALGNSIASTDVADGNLFAWLANANVVPTTPSSTGAILYATAGGLGVLSTTLTLTTSTLTASVSGAVSISGAAGANKLSLSSPSGGKVVGLGAAPSAGDMPLFSGDRVTWMPLATTIPTAPSSTGVTILAADEGGGGTELGFSFVVKSPVGGFKRLTIVGTQSNTAVGGAAVLPPDPVDFIKAYMDGTAILIPYYHLA